MSQLIPHSKNRNISKVCLAVSIALTSFVMHQSAFAIQVEQANDSAEQVERITVTGSRIKRAEFSSASPIQVIDMDVSRDLGFFDTAEILQTTSQTAGVQIDNTFAGYVTENGPGASTIGFRGLGAESTLVLINGRRVSPAGAGGAPVAADLNLIPSILVKQIENLYDGASTVYGSDAIAGVANLILKDNVDGFEFRGNVSVPESGGGEETTLSALWGKTDNKYRFSIAAEYYNRESQSFGQNDFVNDCNEFRFEDAQGNIYSQNREIGPLSEETDACVVAGEAVNGIVIPGYGLMYYTPNFTNTGIPNFSDDAIAFPLSLVGLVNNAVGMDTDGDGIVDTGVFDANGDGFRDFDRQDPLYIFGRTDRGNAADWVSGNERFSLYANGDYFFGNSDDTRFFYEAMYAKRDSQIFQPGAQLFTSVSASNPFNVCGTDLINGTGCYDASGYGAIVGFPEDFRQINTTALVNVQGNRDTTSVSLSQYRLVAGFDGELSALDNFGEGAWEYEVSANYSASNGVNSITGVNAVSLQNSLNNTSRNSEGDIVCDPDCVPVNLFATSLYQVGGGTFATQAETDYLMSERRVETDIEQTVLSAFVRGDIASLPWNEQAVPLILGVEYRKDEIQTDANDVASEGLLLGFSSDKGADGSRNLKEIFFETELPLLRDQEFAEELTLTLAGRITDESYYDAEEVYSIKSIYRPNDWLTVRGTKGTSFRAPNLRERFLNGTSGRVQISDLCVVPDDARQIDGNGVATYLASGDNREQRVLNACSANGVDPTQLGLGTALIDAQTSVYQTEIVNQGTTNLRPETSTATTLGFVIEQDFSDAFDLTFSATRFNIEVENSVAELTQNQVLSLCYDNADAPQGNSDACAFIERDNSGLVNSISASYINIGFESSKGTDFNIAYNQAFDSGFGPIAVSMDLVATKLSEQITDSLGLRDNNVGEPGTPEWRGTARFAFKVDDLTVNWQARYIGDGEFDEPGEFDLSNPGAPCVGLGIACRPVSSTDSYTVHNASVNYMWNDVSITLGLQNVFNEAPPEVNTNLQAFYKRNIPLGIGYDLTGRTAYLSVNTRF